MKLLSRYVAAGFLRAFAFGMGIFLVLIFLGHIFDSFVFFARSSASLGTMLLYLWLEVPFFGLKVLPIAALLATLSAIASLKRTGEWVAAQASGYRPGELVAPLLACALGVAVFTFVVQETVLPYCHTRADAIYRDYFKRRESPGVWRKVVLMGKHGSFVTADLFDAGRGRMERVVLDAYTDLELSRQLDARSAGWDKNLGQWVFFDGVRRDFEPGSLLPSGETPFTRLESGLDVPPEGFIPESRDPDEMSLSETGAYIRKLRELGASPRQALVAFHSKLAFPFANLVICAFGIPFGLAIKRTSRSLHFAGALAVAFVYWWFISLGQTLGEAGRLPPFIAAWLGNIVFGALALAGLKRARL